ncbi:type 1 glutamine amidotransferase [Pollutibacter soli]|uniref:type 1 glutamine amidotransferase n=1 Tax=Pollutibacter soli TaxID=3034157 RepID=UPI00301415C5
MDADKSEIKVAILDLYAGAPNQGMRCIRDLLKSYAQESQLNLTWDEFDVRIKHEVPNLDYDIYISSGGPGSPLESEGSAWERHYFHWLSQVEKWNANPARRVKKFVFFICHSFQLVCRHHKIAHVTKRKSTAFGVFPVHILPDGENDPVFAGLHDPFYAVDSRDYQVLQPFHNKIKQIGAKLLCIEKERPHVPLERAVMGIRFSEYIVGMQFHPEADAHGMSIHLQTEEKKKVVVETHGYEKWESMITQLNDPDKILWTYAHIIPNFLRDAVGHLQGAVVNI